ncbi:bifunctional sulfate adenylyltransferase/adenylylsulfate kinase [Candidatus Uhrbacteria bacterium]|nr:bifunctional sulfate adenylyltransferase/adenylylsulfate kinase [Candidatus Uhrbacteria bacterium]
MPSNSEIAKLKQIILNHKQICDLELILNEAFAPLRGFMTEAEYQSVLDNTRLPSGQIWPIPVNLDVPANTDISIGEDVVLVDPYLKPLAQMHVESVYTPSKEYEAEKVFGTSAEDHAGIRALYEKAHSKYIGGTVKKINNIHHYDFQDIRLSPAQTKELFRQNHWEKIIGFQTRNPIHRAHFEIIKNAHTEHGANILLHPAVGPTKSGDINYISRVRTYRAVQEKYANHFALLSLLPLAMRMAGPKSALWHALIRKNYGCTHFIIGRDHAGPGADSSGKPFYGPNEAINYVKSFEDEIGIKIITTKEMVYASNKKTYISKDKLDETDEVKKISGTEFREMLRQNQPIPDWFSFPEVISELKKIKRLQGNEGLVIFFTGLSGSGKTTLAESLYAYLRENQDREITFLDGDVIRQNLSKGLGFSKDDREANVKRIGFVASEIARHGGIVICCAIAPYESSRNSNRDLINNSGKYIEVYLSTPLEVCMERDAKGLYAKVKQGLIKGFTGVDDPYEVPQDPEITIDTSERSLNESINEIVKYLQSNRHLDI